MKTPGITVRPLRQMTGEAEFNEVFFDNVRVPRREPGRHRLHEGWAVAITTLAYERDLLTFIRHISLRNAAPPPRPPVRERGRAQDPLVRQKLAAIWIGEQALQLNAYRSLTRILRGGQPGPEGSTSKLFWSQLDQELAQVATEVLGPAAQLGPGAAGRRTKASGSSTRCWPRPAGSAPGRRRSSATSWASACSACPRTDSPRGDT